MKGGQLPPPPPIFGSLNGDAGGVAAPNYFLHYNLPPHYEEATYSPVIIIAVQIYSLFDLTKFL